MCQHYSLCNCLIAVLVSIVNVVLVFTSAYGLCKQSVLQCGRHCCGLWWSSQAVTPSIDVCRSYVVSKVQSNIRGLFDNPVSVCWTFLLLFHPADHQWKYYWVSLLLAFYDCLIIFVAIVYFCPKQICSKYFASYS